MTAELDMKRIPEHIAIIIGVETVKKITSECARLGVKYLTLYTFSTENWNRPAYEIEALMGLVLSFVEMDLFTDNSIRFRMVGDMDRLPQSVQDKIHYMEDLTKDGKRMTVIMAMSYSSKQELTRATRLIAEEVKEGKLQAEDITEQTINDHLFTNFMPESCVSPTICCGSAPIQNSISVTPTGPTSTKKPCIRQLPTIKVVSVVLARRKHRWKARYSL